MASRSIRSWASALVLGLVLLAGCAGLALWFTDSSADNFSWRTSEVRRDDVRRVVSATGTLEADPTVLVGTQVSGIVAELLVDFNDVVVRGQVLARIDTALLDADVASASARLAEARAQHSRLHVEHQRLQGLHVVRAATDQELLAASADLAVAAAQVRSAEVSLERARRNLRYATVTSPIDGTVVNRAVDVGQTVNAGFSAPELFRIAGDLSRMVILVNVDESDIGLIQPGQVAEFTVQAYPDRRFSGTVRQLRLAAKVDQSVVTYVVVVDTNNPERVLYPGMTATVEFVVAEAKEVLCVANAALRFRPDAAAPELASKMSAQPGAGGGRRAGARSGAEPQEGVLYTLDGATAPEEGAALRGGSTRAVPVKVGLRGADCTEVSGEGLSDALVVVLGVDREADASTSSPLGQPAQPSTRRGGF